MNTTTKTAQKSIEKHAARVMNATEARLIERAKDERHGKKWIANRIENATAALDAIRAASDIVSISIGVEWRKSYTWGMNPYATVAVETTGGAFKRYTGTASGCGYCKESAAIASALNECDAAQRLLIVAAAKKGFPYGARVSEYGAHFSGGVGVSAFRAIFEFCGFKWENVASGKTYDSYRITR